MFGTAALPLLHATMPTLSIPRAAVMMIRVIRAFCFLGVFQHIPIPSCSQVPNRVVLTNSLTLCMKHANRRCESKLLRFKALTGACDCPITVLGQDHCPHAGTTSYSCAG